MPSFIETNRHLPARSGFFPWGQLILGVILLIIILSRFYLAVVRPIQFFDDSLYLATTDGLLKYKLLPLWSLNPGVTVLNFLWYYPLRSIPLGLDYAGRFGLVVAHLSTFALLGLAIHSLLRDRRWVTVALALGVVLPPFWDIRLNLTDLYYMVCVIGMFYLFYRALAHPSTHRAWLWAAIGIVIATSIRNDATIVYLAGTFVYLVIMWQTAELWRRKIGMAFLFWLMPMIVMQGGYALFASQGVYNAFNGYPMPNFDGTEQRLYLAFEQGEGYARRFELIPAGQTWWADGRTIAAELYGSAEANDNNVFRAIANNPSAWLNRLKWNARDFLFAWHDAFLTHSLPLFVIALWGFGIMVRHHFRAAVAVIVILAPTTVYFLLTFWHTRYVITLAPLWLLLAVYALHHTLRPNPIEGEALSKVRGVRPTLWQRMSIWYGIVAIVVAGVGAIAVITLTRWKVDIPVETLPILLLLALLLVWRWFLPIALTPLLRNGIGVAVGGLLAFGTFAPLLSPEGGMTPFQIQARDYVGTMHQFYQNQRVCYNKGDLDSLSLIWYAHQVPVEVPVDLINEMYYQRLAATLAEYECKFVLVAGDGRGKQNGPVNHPTVRVIFDSMYSDIVFFEIKAP